MRVLVTGGAGYIGSVVTAQLLAVDHEVVVVDDLSTGHADAVAPGAAFHQMSIAELDPVLGSWDIDAVVHFAAKSLVGESVTDPAPLLAQQRRRHDRAARLVARPRGRADRVLLLGRDLRRLPGAADPRRPPRPDRPIPYGASKLAIDLALTDYARAYGLTAVSLRYFNVAGALHTADGQMYGERHATETHLVPNALRRGHRRRRARCRCSAPTTRRRTAPACATTSTSSISALAHVAALTAGEPGEHHVLNLGSGTGYSVREVLSAVERVVGRPVPVTEAERRSGDPAVLVAAIDRAAQVLGWQPQRTLDQMVADAWEFVSFRQK